MSPFYFAFFLCFLLIPTNQKILYSEAMNVVLLGPQGSGKGTQGELLAEKTGMYYFDAGAYLREISKTRPDIDEIVNKRGALLPDDMVYKLVRDHFIEKNQFDNIIFDGYPRSLPQWNLISEFLKSHGTTVEKVFLLTINEEETVRRLSALRIDPNTDIIYNLITNPPPPTVDQSTLIHREDDQPEAIKVRLSAYHTSTQPLVNELRSQGKLIEIDGTQSITDIHQHILEKMSQNS